MLDEQNKGLDTVGRAMLANTEGLRVSDGDTEAIVDLTDDQLQRLETDLLGKEEHLEREEIEDEIPF